MRNIFWIMLISASLVFVDEVSFSALNKQEGIVFYVSKDGSDSFSGRTAEVNKEKTDGPFATIQKAQNVVRSLKKNAQLPVGGITIYIREGIYTITKSLEFTEQDSGTEKAPIIYCAYRDEKVKLIGGKEIEGFMPVNDQRVLKRIDPAYRDKILQVDLKSQGITDFGEITPRGFRRPMNPSGLELFFQDEPMQLARWPNSGWLTIAGVPAEPKGGKFFYDGDRPKRWLRSGDIWLHGYWTWDWADSYEKVRSINVKKREFVTYEPHGVYGYSSGRRYYVLNVLEELDEPGEWYLDRKTGIMYFWPPAPLREGKAFVSLLDTIIQMQNVSYVIFQGLEIGVCRGTAIKMINGSHNRIADCTLRNIGNVAINIDGGTESGIAGCDIHGCGDGGIRLSGGDRRTLTPANNYVYNNHVYDYSRWVRTYAPGVMIGGVGNRISHNLIHDGSNSAIILEGNEHVIEFNEIHHVCMENSDAGAFYMGRDYSQRGNTIRYNFFHHVGPGDVQAVYLDDFTSGTKIFGNVFYKTERGVVIGGGRDNIVENNIFVDCRKAVQIDARGLDWAKIFFNGGDTTLFDELKAVKYKEPPYSLRYPELLKLAEDNPAIPKGNVISYNVISGGKWLTLYYGIDKEIITIKNNLIAEEPAFVDRHNMNFQLKNDSPAYKLGFRFIPIERIGLCKDKSCTHLPSE